MNFHVQRWYIPLFISQTRAGGFAINLPFVPKEYLLQKVCAIRGVCLELHRKLTFLTQSDASHRVEGNKTNVHYEVFTTIISHY